MIVSRAGLRTCSLRLAPFRGAPCRISKSIRLPHMSGSRNLGAINAAAPVEGTLSETAPQIPYITTEDNMPEECSPSWVEVDQKESSLYTKVIIDSPDYPGLLRTVAWVLGGLRIPVQHATINCELGMAHNELWVTTEKGEKLPDFEASMLQERLSDFVMFCKPISLSPKEWASSNVTISNGAHPKWTVMTVRGNRPNHSGFFLELVSIISGSGALVHRGKVIGKESIPLQLQEPLATGASMDDEMERHDFSAGPLYEFFISDESGKKMEAPRIAALLYMYDMIMGTGHMPFIAPNMDNFLNKNVIAVSL